MAYSIRPFAARDRPAVRRLSCETAFLDLSRGRIFADDEVLADVLTLYFTDHEPGSCFVAEDNAEVIGYLIGAKDVRAMRWGARLLPGLFVKMWRRKTFLSKTNLRFLSLGLRSLLMGEFVGRNVADDFPATLHINIDGRCRRLGVGRGLIEAYLDLLRRARVKGVHLSTLSPDARSFFLKMGFVELYRRKRSFLKPYTGQEVFVHVLGRAL